MNAQETIAPTKKWKMGDAREDGKLFWCVAKGKEYWVTPERFIIRKLKSKRASDRYLATDYGKQKRAERQIKNKLLGIKKKPQRAEARAAWMQKYKASEAYKEAKERRRIKKKSSLKNMDSWRRELAMQRHKLKTDPVYCISQRCRRRIRSAILKPDRQNIRTVEMLGCSYAELKSHIENRFAEGMNWGNRVMWHIDHVIPLSSAKTTEEIIKLCHFSNLQPLWAIDNIRKGNKHENKH